MISEENNDNLTLALQLQKLIEDSQNLGHEILRPALQKIAPESNEAEIERIIALAQILMRGCGVSCASIATNSDNKSVEEIWKIAEDHNLQSMLEINQLFSSSI